MAPPKDAKSAYLIVYNLLLAAGWSYVLSQCVLGTLEGRSTHQLGKDVEIPLKLSQTAAVLEIAHSLLKLVRSPFMTTITQVFSRVWLLWGILNLCPEDTMGGVVKLLKVGDVQLSLNLYTLLFAWSFTEVVRYLFYALKELNGVPFVLTWLRYTTFYVLYPLGVSSEMAMVYLALPRIKAEGLWTLHMPNPLNFAFDYYIMCLLICMAYLPGFPKLYTYMMKQRKLVLAPKAKTE